MKRRLTMFGIILFLTSFLLIPVTVMFDYIGVASASPFTQFAQPSNPTSSSPKQNASLMASTDWKPKIDAQSVAYFEKEWMFMRKEKNGKNEITPLKTDYSRIAVLFNVYSGGYGETTKKEMAKIDRILGVESVRIIPVTQWAKEEWVIFRVKRLPNEEAYFWLLEEVRRNSLVATVSPVAYFEGKTFIITNRVKIRIKAGHDPKSDMSLGRFLQERYPMFSSYRSQKENENFFVLMPNSTMNAPFLKMVDLLAQDVYVLWALPELIEVETPIKGDAVILSCGTKTSSPSIYTTDMSKEFCLVFTIDYVTSRVELKTEEERFRTLNTLPFHKNDFSAYPMSEVTDISFEKKDVSKNKTHIRVEYKIKIHDTGDFLIPGLEFVKYVEKGFDFASELDLVFPARPIKVVSQIHQAMTDLNPIVVFPKLAKPVEKTPAPVVSSVPPLLAKDKIVMYAEWFVGSVFVLGSWSISHKSVSLLYFIFAMASLGAITLFALECLKPISASGVVFTGKALTEIGHRFRFWKTRRTFQKLVKADKALSPDDYFFEIRRLLKRFFEEQIPNFKSRTNPEILASVKELELDAYLAPYRSMPYGIIPEHVRKNAEDQLGYEDSLYYTLKVIFDAGVDHILDKNEVNANIERLLAILKSKRYLLKEGRIKL